MQYLRNVALDVFEVLIVIYMEGVGENVVKHYWRVFGVSLYQLWGENIRVNRGEHLF